MKKIIAFLLVLLLIIPAVVACQQSDDPVETQADESEPLAGDSEAESAETETFIDDEDTLGEYDFNKREYKVLTRGSTEYEFYSEAGVSGNVLNREIYYRNGRVEERFNVKITTDPQVGDWTKQEPMVTALRNDVMTGEAGYSLVSGHTLIIAPLTLENLATDMTSLPEFNINKAWWSKLMFDETNLDGKMLYTVGDINATLYEYLEVVFVNETLFESLYGGDDGVDLFEMIDNMEWTWEKYVEFSKGYGMGATEEETSYGALINVHSWRANLIGLDVQIADKNEQNGRFEVPDSPSEKLLEVMDNMNEFYKLNNIYFANNHGTDEKASNKQFASGKALFYGQTLMNAASLRNDMEDVYGLLPQPLYDEFQEQYYTNCRDSVSAIMVPNTSKNTETDREMVGVVTEALCMYSYEHVVPAYYEVTMQRQYFNSQRYVDILNLIRDGLTFDYAFAWFYGDLEAATGGANPYDQIGRGCFGIHGKTEKDPAGQYAQYKDKWTNYLEYCYGQMEVYGIIDG